MSIVYLLAAKSKSKKMILYGPAWLWKFNSGENYLYTYMQEGNILEYTITSQYVTPRNIRINSSSLHHKQKQQYLVKPTLSS